MTQEQFDIITNHFKELVNLFDSANKLKDDDDRVIECMTYLSTFFKYQKEVLNKLRNINNLWLLEI